MPNDRKTGWGGARRGAGRKQGTLNPRTIARNEAARLLPYCADPLEWLMALMGDDRQDLRLRIDAARALMPYVHAKL
ncbi:MAG: hypothetical protein IPH35_05550 [Rhodoferax sp.]|nr:hypothetical protein [Rhodoferax sp.]